ncbi:MAG TPA: NAD-dependent epimerase/dehydratase family protein [Bacteroidia bacterium]|nr:NAD-dependent epimerase/dehydratase family protein [Bacteroidia bacterium]
MSYQPKILVIGAGGQIGIELCEALNIKYGHKNVIASDIKPIDALPDNIFESLDVLDKNKLLEVVKKHQITDVYLLAALLSATAEKNPDFAWKLNMDGLFNVLNLAKDKIIQKVFWPSSIAVFGPSTPKQNTPQYTIMDPNTVYGISKLAGERWCEWYYQKYNVDVRSIRYPGLIGWKSQPGGGTTDYAVHIFYAALKDKKYTCFLKEDTMLPMMHIEDAVRATIELMEAPKEKITIRSSYNLAAMSFTPAQIASKIKEHIPEFEIDYQPDFRQSIADSWPQSIDDSIARKDWGWNHHYDLDKLVVNMLENIKRKV